MKTGGGLEKIETGGLCDGTNTGCLGAGGCLVCTNTLWGLDLTGRLVDVKCTPGGLVLIGLMVVVIIIGGGRYGGGIVVMYRLVQGCQGRDVGR